MHISHMILVSGEAIMCQTGESGIANITYFYYIAIYIQLDNK